MVVFTHANFTTEERAARVLIRAAEGRLVRRGRRRGDRVDQCNWERWERGMHMLQDFYSHFDNGFRWFRLGHVRYDIFAWLTRRPILGLTPRPGADDPNDEDLGNPQAVENMEIAVATLEGIWVEHCGALGE